MKKGTKTALALTAVCAACAAVFIMRKKTPPQLNVSLLEKSVLTHLPNAEITSIVDADEKGCYFVEMICSGEKYEAVVCIKGSSYNITNLRKAAEENGLYEGI